MGFSISGEGSEEIFSDTEEEDNSDEFKEPEYDIYKFTRGVEIKIMSNLINAEGTAKKFGGKSSDYLEIEMMDSSKCIWG